MENKYEAPVLGQTHTQQGWVCLPWLRMVLKPQGLSQHLKGDAVLDAESSV